MKKLFVVIALLITGILSAQEPIRGTWVTNVGSDALLNAANVKAAVTLCKQKGINTIFVVVWNGGMTMYLSKHVKKYIGLRQDPVYNGFDPIKEIVKEGHKQGLKVHAWFEFGFSYSYQDSNSVWAKKYPHWLSRNNKGEPLKKNDFYWWNAFHPEVRSFLNDLVLEVIKKYKVDGIQGDDRMPAMPAEGGYDDFTKALYIKETGKQVPNDPREAHWLQWKADKISAFGKELYTAVKKKNKNCLVTWSPSIYPWSKEQYLQDWPAWLKGGYADYFLPQLYRYDIKGYEKILKELAEQIPASEQHRFYPGILTGLANGYKISNEMLQQTIALNRKYGFKGECLFYFESLKHIDKLY